MYYPVPEYLEHPDGIVPESARLRAALRGRCLLPVEDTIPEDVNVGAFNQALDDERSYMEDGR